jgi:hypothetical protein
LLEFLSLHYNPSLDSRKGGSSLFDPTRADLDFDRIRFLVVNFELEEDVSLSWYLSRRERDAIRHAEGKIRLDQRSALRGMVQWWNTPLSVKPIWEMLPNEDAREEPKEDAKE